MERRQSASLSDYCASIAESLGRFSRTNCGAMELLIESLFLTRSATSQYANSRCELSHELTRVRGRGAVKFKSIEQARLFFRCTYHCL
jgi:hypothetical protein